jgi:DNA primase
MNIPEEVLYNEVNNIRRQKSFQDRNKYPGPEDLPAPPVQVPKTVKQEPTTSFSEKEIIRLLLKYGSAELERIKQSDDKDEAVITVADYIINDFISDELSFDNPLYARIFEEFRIAVEQGVFLNDKQFIKNEDPAISKLSADILSDSYQLSRIWINKQAYVETEDMKLKDIVPDVVLKFKSDKIKIRLKDIMTQLEEAAREDDQEKILLLQKKDQTLKKALRTISDNLGKRIIL